MPRCALAGAPELTSGFHVAGDMTIRLPRLYVILYLNSSSFGIKIVSISGHDPRRSYALTVYIHTFHM